MVNNFSFHCFFPVKDAAFTLVKICGVEKNGDTYYKLKLYNPKVTEVRTKF